MRPEIVVPGPGVATAQGAEPLDVGHEPGKLRVDHHVRAIGGDHPALPPRLADHPVPAEVVERAFGRGDRLDVEPLEQRARAELRTGEAVGDLVVGGVRGLGRQPRRQPEHRLKRVVEPHPTRRAAQQPVALGEAPPDRAPVGLGRPAIDPRHAEVRQRHSLRAQHPEHVMVGRDEQLRRVRKRRVLGEPARIGVPVRAEDGKVGYAREQRAREATRRRLDGEQPVRVQQRHRHLPPAQPFGIETSRPIY